MKTSDFKMLSIVIPVFNEEAYLERLVEKVVGQPQIGRAHV